MTLPPSVPREEAPSPRTGLVLRGGDGTAAAGGRLVSGLGATHLENRKSANVTLSPASLKVSAWGHVEVNMPERKSIHLSLKFLFYCLVLTEQLVGQMNRVHKSVWLQRMEWIQDLYWRWWSLQD